MASIERAVAIIGASGGLGEATAMRVAKDAAVTIGYFRGKDTAKVLVDRIVAAGMLKKTKLLTRLPRESRCGNHHYIS